MLGMLRCCLGRSRVQVRLAASLDIEEVPVVGMSYSRQLDQIVIQQFQRQGYQYRVSPNRQIQIQNQRTRIQNQRTRIQNQRIQNQRTQNQRTQRKGQQYQVSQNQQTQRQPDLNRGIGDSQIKVFQEIVDQTVKDHNKKSELVDIFSRIIEGKCSNENQEKIVSWYKKDFKPNEDNIEIKKIKTLHEVIYSWVNKKGDLYATFEYVFGDVKSKKRVAGETRRFGEILKCMDIEVVSTHAGPKYNLKFHYDSMSGCLGVISGLQKMSVEPLVTILKPKFLVRIRKETYNVMALPNEIYIVLCKVMDCYLNLCEKKISEFNKINNSEKLRLKDGDDKDSNVVNEHENLKDEVAAMYGDLDIIKKSFEIKEGSPERGDLVNRIDSLYKEMVRLKKEYNVTEIVKK